MAEKNKPSDESVQELRKDIAERMLSETAEIRNGMKAAEWEKQLRLVAEKVLKEKEERYRPVFQRFPLPFAFYEIMRDRYGHPSEYRVLEVNDAYIKQLANDLTADEIVGRTITQSTTSVLESKWVRAFSSVARTATTCRIDSCDESADRFFDVLIFRFRRDVLAAVIEDVTAKRKVLQLQDNRELLQRNVLDLLPLFVCRFRPDGAIIYANAAYYDLMDGNAEEIKEHNLMPFIPEEDRDLYRKHLRSAGRSAPLSKCQHRLILPDRPVRWIEWSTTVVLASDGSIESYQSAGQDVADLIQKDAEFLTRQEELERLVEQLTGRLKKAEQENSGRTEDLTERFQLQEENLRQSARELAKVRDELKRIQKLALKGDMTVCSECKRVLDDKGRWVNLDVYLRDRTEAKIAGGLCPYCSKRHQTW